MKLGYITSEHLPHFASLMLPEAVQALERGEPLVALGLTEQTVACGALAGYLEGSRFQIISLFVAPDYRRRGGGRLLVETLLELLADNGQAAGVELSYTDTAPDHKSLAPFLETLGFCQENDRGENIFLTTLGQVQQSPFFAGGRAAPADILPFCKIPDICLTMAGKQALLEGAPVPEVPLSDASLDREVSHALFRDKAVQAFVAFDHSCCGHLTLCCAWSGSAGSAALPALLRAAFCRAVEAYPLETEIALQTVNQASARLAAALLPDAVPLSCTYYRPVHGR